MVKKLLPIEEVYIQKLVHGGQGLGLLADGRKCFVWGALPGEMVKAQLTRKKKDWAEAVATEIITTSQDRIEPREPEIFLATSPWQIVNYTKETEYKQSILAETFTREGLSLKWQGFYQDANEFGYRNKMEYNFWFEHQTDEPVTGQSPPLCSSFGAEPTNSAKMLAQSTKRTSRSAFIELADSASKSGTQTSRGKVSLALHRRGTHQKVAVAGSYLATDSINAAGKAIVQYINDNSIEARPLKSVILRSDSSGTGGISLFVNDKAVAGEFSKFQIPNSIFEIIYSNPKSPASVATEVLKTDDRQLCDSLLGRDFKYSTRSFFQVNIPVYEKVLKIIAAEITKQPKAHILDIYSGVGSIGLSVVGAGQSLTMIETSQECTDQAKLNMVGRKNCEVVTATAETALEYITGNEVVILDPPRAGLHKYVVEKLCEVKPSKIIYLSCNPSTQARDVKLLVDAGYKITTAQGFNFFPRTPHIECLVVLER